MQKDPKFTKGKQIEMRQRYEVINLTHSYIDVISPSLLASRLAPECVPIVVYYA